MTPWPKHAILLLAVAGASLALAVAPVLGGGGATGGVDIVPSAAPGPIGQSPDGANGSLGPITVHAKQEFQIVAGGPTDPGLAAWRHVGQDVVPGDPLSVPDWTLDLLLKEPVLERFAGLDTRVKLGGRYLLLDRDETDGERPQLQAHPFAPGWLVVLVGQRTRNGDGSILDSFHSIRTVLILPVPSAGVELAALRSSIGSLLRGTGWDVGFAVVTRGSGPQQVAWGAFTPDDRVALYEIQAR